MSIPYELMYVTLALKTGHFAASLWSFAYYLCGIWYVSNCIQLL